MSWIKRLHCRISLRAMLLVFGLVICLLAYLADVKRRQIEVQKTVSELGGYMSNVNFDNGRCIEPSRSEYLPNWLYVILPERYNYVYATSPEVDDDKLARILTLPGIEGLNISWSTITDKGLRLLKGKSGLKEIQLYDIPTISDEAVLQLKASAKCKIQHRHEYSGK